MCELTSVALIGAASYRLSRIAKPVSPQEFVPADAPRPRNNHVLMACWLETYQNRVDRALTTIWQAQLVNFCNSLSLI